MRKGARVWTDADVATLHRMVGEGALFRDIDTALGRRPNSSAAKYAELRSKARAAELRAPKPSPAPTASHATLTALIFGDPLPGRSALDQR